MKAVTDAVMLCLTISCCSASYTVHRCFGKTDAFIISLVPMVTKMDISLWRIVVFVWFTQQRRSTLSADVTICLLWVCKEKNEANANITRDSFRLVTDSWRRGILWLPHAVWLQLRWARFSLSSWTAVSHWLSSSGVGRHHSSWWVWRPCRS